MRLESCFTDCQWRYNNSTITDRGKDESKNMWKCGNLTSLISPSLHKECRASIRRASGLFVSFCKSLKHDTLYCEWSPSLTFHVLEFIWLVVIEYLYLQCCVPRQITLKLKGTVRAIKDTNYTVCFLHPSHFTTSLWGTTAAPTWCNLSCTFSSCSTNRVRLWFFGFEELYLWAASMVCSQSWRLSNSFIFLLRAGKNPGKLTMTWLTISNAPE